MHGCHGHLASTHPRVCKYPCLSKNLDQALVRENGPAVGDTEVAAGPASRGLVLQDFPFRPLRGATHLAICLLQHAKHSNFMSKTKL